MDKITLGEVCAAVGGRLLCGKSESEISEVVIDSRKAGENTLFVAIKGERTDGHEYIESALKSGGAALSEKEIITDSGAVILVENTVRAIGELAAYYKSRYSHITVGVTGSVGKTTTKDMIAAVLSEAKNTLKTEGNFNNELGLPLTVFRIEKQTEAAVLEMGMSAFGEIHELGRIARPDIAVITNIGMSHIEALGSQEGILKAKLEICDFLGGLLIVNGDDRLLNTVGANGNYELVRYGIDNKSADLVAENVIDKGLGGSEFDCVINGKYEHITLPVAGRHNIGNALSAIIIAERLGMTAQQIKSGLEKVELTGMRMSVEEVGKITLINDCYNAAPNSVRAALGVLSTAKAERRVAILGDILEMGSYAPKEHFALGEFAVKSGAELIITVGESSKHTAEGAKSAGGSNVIYFETTDEAAEFAKTALKSGDTVLVKASRGMHFEKICDAIKTACTN